MTEVCLDGVGTERRGVWGSIVWVPPLSSFFISAGPSVGHPSQPPP